MRPKQKCVNCKRKYNPHNLAWYSNKLLCKMCASGVDVPHFKKKKGV